MTPLGQRDPRWKDKKIGNSSSSLGGYGCTLTCLAMKAGTTPDVVDDALTAVGGFQVDMILWPKINETNLGLRFPDMGRHYAYDNDLVLKEIADSGSCLVEVDFDGVITTPNDRHWVLFIGNQRCYDPWTGNEVATSKYPLRKGFCIINLVPISNSDDNMTEEQKNILKFLTEKNANEGKVREAFGALDESPNKDKQIQTLQARVLDLETSQKDLADRITALESNIQADLKLISDWQKAVETANKKLETQNKTIEDLTTEKNAIKGRYESKCDELRKLDKMTAWGHIKYGIDLLIKKSK